MSGERDWHNTTQREKDEAAISVQTSLLADYEEMVIDDPEAVDLANRVYRRINDLKKTLSILRKRQSKGVGK